ncbi:MAG: methyltransferase domain-containing protein [Anaeromyxobacteraceae bacterium]
MLELVTPNERARHGFSMKWQEAYMRRFYDPGSGFVDGTTEFWNLCRKVISPGSKILEIGSGPSNATSQTLAAIGELHGIDLDPDVRENSALTAAHVIGSTDPFPANDEEYDACVSDFVLEHVEHPDRHLREINRVLRPGGTYVFRTPNRWHYVSVIGSMTPFWFHRLVSHRARGLTGGEHEPYPTFYRMNSATHARALASEHGLVPEQIRMIEKEPSYAMQSRILFLTFMAYERVVNSSDRLGFLRANILGVLRKP